MKLTNNDREKLLYFTNQIECDVRKAIIKSPNILSLKEMKENIANIIFMLRAEIESADKEEEK